MPGLYCFRRFDWNRNQIDFYDFTKIKTLHEITTDVVNSFKRIFNFDENNDDDSETSAIPLELLMNPCKYFYEFNKRYKIKRFDEFVYDQHTREGKKMGRNGKFWIEKSSVVLREDSVMTRAEHKQFYEDCKLLTLEKALQKLKSVPSDLQYRDSKSISTKRKKQPKSINNDDDNDDDGDDGGHNTTKKIKYTTE